MLTKRQKSKAQTMVDTTLAIINNCKYYSNPDLTKGNYQFALRKTKSLLSKLANIQKGLPNSVKIQGITLFKQS
jgi:hypothetical protein